MHSDRVGSSSYSDEPYTEKNKAKSPWLGWLDVAAPSSDRAQIKKVVSIWSSLEKERDVWDVESHLRADEAIKTPFKEVSYRDKTGKTYRHWVHPVQTPIPWALAEGLNEEEIKVLEYQDYRVDLFLGEVQREMTQNALMANTHLIETENLNFHLTKDTPKDMEGKRRVLSPYGQRDINYSLEKGVGVATTIGLRKNMEDTHLVEIFHSKKTAIGCTAIFDGHGGKECSEHAKRTFIPTFMKWMDHPSLAIPNGDVKVYNALNLTFADMNRSYQSYEDGTTANLCLLILNELWVVNLGDSRAILIEPEKTTQLSEDQKPDMPQHRFFIEGRGAFVSRRGSMTHLRSPYMVAPGRSLGDHHLKGGMYPRPLITKYLLSKSLEETYLVQGCDGVFDVASSRQIGDLVRERGSNRQSPSQIAFGVAASVFSSGSGDNISVLVTPLEKQLKVLSGY